VFECGLVLIGVYSDVVDIVKSRYLRNIGMEEAFKQLARDLVSHGYKDPVNG
jgi:hypothetical protein